MKKLVFVTTLLLAFSASLVPCHGTNIPEATCKSILNRLYNDYVFGDRYDEFDQAVQELFTANAQQKLREAYEYDCEGVCYAIWALRTNAQDSKEEGGKSGVEDIWRVIGNVYEVHYSDGGWHGSTRFLFTTQNGEVKIDDFLRGYDDSAADFGPWNVDTLDVVVDDQDNFIGTYLFTDGDNFIVMVQDYAEVPVAGHRKVTYSAENGQGVIYTLRSRVNVRKLPTTKSAVVTVMPTPSDGLPAESFPCLGKSDEWYKIRIHGKVGYVREDLVEWSVMDDF